MNPPLGKNELLIRLGFFFGILVIMFLWERMAPHRPFITSKAKRWFSNLGLVLIDSVAVRLIFPTALTGLAFFVHQSGFGTYRPQPAQGHLEMTIGLDQYKEPRKLTLPWLLVLPFIGKLGKYPMTRSPGVE
mgnify:FL=1